MIVNTKADLHLHTTASDGRLTPREVVELVYSKGLRSMAITDHDTLQGYIEAKSYADTIGMDLLPGVELTTDYNGRECHILAYGFDLKSESMQSLFVDQRYKRKERASEIVRKLNKLGFDLEMDEIRAESGKATISRNHIADVMRQKSFVATRREAFDRYLFTGGPAYVQNEYISAIDAIDKVHECGGVCILAHPGHYYIFEDLRYFLNAGIDGLEYIHPSHNFQTQKKLKEYADNYQLLLTGGSDFHGIKPFEDQLVGTVCVDRSRVDAILDRSMVAVGIKEIQS